MGLVVDYSIYRMIGEVGAILSLLEVVSQVLTLLTD
jgi:hypothetical protein